MNYRNLFPLIISSLLLVGCNSNNTSIDGTTSKTEPTYNIETFYEAFNKFNWKATSSYSSCTMINEDILNIDDYEVEGITGGYIKNSEGIYEYVITEDGFEVEGMISPNLDLKTYEFINSPCDLRYIDISNWSDKGNNCYELNIAQLDDSEKYGLFYAFEFDRVAANVDSVNKLEVNFVNDQAIFLGQYKDKSGKTKFATVMTFSDFGKAENAQISSFLKENPTFAKFSDWTDLQKTYFKNYGVPSPFFFDGYTKGLYLSFANTDTYGIITAYDCMFDPSNVEAFKTALINDGYELTKSGEVSSTFEKNVQEDGVNYIVEMGFVANEDLASEADKICYPNGYLQVVYSYTGSYTHKTIDQLNDIFGEYDIGSLDDVNKVVEDIIVTDGTEQYNAYCIDSIKAENPTFDGVAVYKQLTIKLSIPEFQTAHSYVYNVYENLLKKEYTSLDAAYADLCGESYSGNRDVDFNELTGSYAGKYSIIGYKNYKDIGITSFQIYDYDYENDKNTISILIEIYSKEFFDIIMGE